MGRGSSYLSLISNWLLKFLIKLGNITSHHIRMTLFGGENVLSVIINKWKTNFYDYGSVFTNEVMMDDFLREKKSRGNH